MSGNLNDIFDVDKPKPAQREIFMAAVVIKTTDTTDRQYGLVVAASGEGIEMEIEHVSMFLDDLGVDYPPTSGLWVWEGTIKWTSDYEGDGDVDYVGDWRRPTATEAQAYMNGLDPFAAPVILPEPSFHRKEVWKFK